MPELPEVETTRSGIAPHVENKTISQVVVRCKKLRYPVPTRMAKEALGQRVDIVERRGKYLLLRTVAGTILVHLGMSGSLRLVDSALPAEKHDHVDIVLNDQRCLRLHDPRRFGAVLWIKGDPYDHDLLSSLGPEPLNDAFDGDYLYQRSRGRRVSIKQFVMDSKLVVGVGNIYASESLFMAGMRPQTAAGKVSRVRYQKLAAVIKDVLSMAIKQGGTTLRDFVDGSGKPGYFQQQLNVYGRDGEPCNVCSTAIKHLQQGQRSSYYCPCCQR
ncbi:bifunctional DNA-formamidopyrimidine glycosylase/DNA-(apurinic or apyrimidinic site) lyase [Pseudomonadota bacterium]